MYSTSYRGNNYTLSIALRIPDDLSIVKFKLDWDSQNPLGTVNVERNNVPPPRALTVPELQEFHHTFGESVASWSESKLSQMVGNGECWTLAQQAIEQSSGGRAMSPQGLTHGALIYHRSTQGVHFSIDEIRRGDIIQYDKVRLQHANGGYSVVGDPDHTAVVTSVNGDEIHFLNQNIGGVKRVQPGQQNFNDLTAGEIRIFRVVSKEWAGDLKA